MPVVDYEQYCEMLDRARTGKVRLSRHQRDVARRTANAVLKGLADSRSDGIIQVSTGGGAFASGAAVKDMALGAISIAEHVHRVAARYPIYVALHTDHCQADKLDTFVMPLVEETERRRAAGKPNLFNSHMFDGSALPLEREPRHRREAARAVHEERPDPRDRSRRRRRRGGRRQGERRGEALHDARRHAGSRAAAERRSRARATCSPRPSATCTACTNRATSSCKPSILKDCQDAVVAAFGEAARFYLVFHGGSGSELRDIHEALDYGVVKMNVDTDMQYAFTRAIADHCFKNYDGVLRVDGEVGNKKAYDPRSYLTPAEKAMAARVMRAATRAAVRRHDDDAVSGWRAIDARQRSRFHDREARRLPRSRRRCPAFGSRATTIACSTTRRSKGLNACRADGRALPPAMESAGPRQTLFFDPATLACGIVTCGGLCPGLNDVIRAIVLSLHHHYGVNRDLRLPLRLRRPGAPARARSRSS